jgi:hypothetical protein
MRVVQSKVVEPSHSLSGYYWALLAIILIGAFFRWAALGTMNDMLHVDEAYNGVDALSFLESPSLTPFLSANFGRESGWCYLLVPFVAVLEAQPFALRIAVTMAGILTIAAAYRLGTNILGRRGAIWVAAVLAVLYWHVHISHLALRAILVPLVGSLALASLLRAHRINSAFRWAVAGLGLGCLAYTYFSAYLWIAYTLVILAWWLVADRDRRRGILVMLLVAGVLFLPMLLYVYRHPQQMFGRPSSVAAFDLAKMWDNLGLWAKAWFHRGDPNAEFNLPGRPILDPYLGALFCIGVIGLPFVSRRRWHAVWVVGLAFFATLPSLLSEAAPHFLRAFGLTLPLALIAGGGVWAVECGVRRVAGRYVALVVPCVLLTIVGATSFRDFHNRWLHHPEVFVFMEQYLTRSIGFVKDTVPRETPIYFSPLSLDHPVPTFLDVDQGERQVGAFDSHSCLVVSDVPVVYVSLTMYEPSFQRRLSRWSDTVVLAQDQSAPQISPRYTILQAVPRTPRLFGDGADVVWFDDAIKVRSLSEMSDTVKKGSLVSIELGLSTLRPLSQVYSLFVHLYGDPTPYEGGPLWSQVDDPICASYPTSSWRSNEIIVQAFDLSIPDDVPPGRYIIVAGLYDALTGTRLPITAPSPNPWNHVVLREVEIEDDAD